ncbi:hypothetical protein Y695_01201 [Hydrogenophaga sp. T4]|nr:hypothetical protein Y695_01201 [Hydrogenophaga sp. T4]
MLEFGFGLAREAGDEGAAHHDLRTQLAPTRDALQVALATGRALHALEHIGVAVLQRNVQVRQAKTFGHQRNDVVHMRVRVHVVQANPGTKALGQFAQRAHQIEHARLDRLAVPEPGAVLHIHPIGRGVLAHHQQFLDTRLEQLARFGQYIADRSAHQITAHGRDDAEGAAVVASFADFQVGVMARRELDALRRHQIDKRVVRLGQVQVHSSITSWVACGPVTASTLGCICRTMLPPPSASRAPRHPVTITLPFSAKLRQSCPGFPSPHRQ